MPRLVELLMSICQKLGLIQDFVVETGTSNGWNYRKWNSGRAECWITFTQSIAPYTPISGMYAFNLKRNYPFGFKSIDSINFNADINDYNHCGRENTITINHIELLTKVTTSA